MANGKVDEQLEFARELPKEVLLKDTNLAAGYSKEDNSWELIVKYEGDIMAISNELDIVIEILAYGYAIVIIEENLIDIFSRYPQIIYIEKPRELFFSINNSRRISCINGLQTSNIDGLFGESVIVAIIDSGIDYSHMDFRNEDGTTRILKLWDQTVAGRPPDGFIFGTEYDKETINIALSKNSKNEQLSIVNSVDVTGHGTAVAGIACGNGASSGGIYKGVASKSDIVVVKIGNSVNDSFPRTSRIMEGLKYVLDIAIQENKPIAINLSFGNNYGAHNGKSLLEQYIDEVSLTWKNSICVGAGNEGELRKHYSGNVKNENNKVELLIGKNQDYISLQIWKNYKDDMLVSVYSPNGKNIVINKFLNKTSSYIIDNTIVYVYYGMPNPISLVQEINIIFYPLNNYLEEGIWILEINPVNITYGEYDIWIGSGIEFSEETGFLEASSFKTLTIPSTSNNVITVGAYNGYTDSYATFSGKGDSNYFRLGKPDLVAPGVEINSAAVGGGYEVKNGTSMATPFVTGSAALMLEWGIIRKNDIYLYGDKVKAYLLKGARSLSEFEQYPNSYVGWGALCLEKSLPDMY